MDLKSVLVGHLDRLNQAVLHKLEGLSEYELRRPMTPTATNLLGVAMHLTSLQAEYFGKTFDRPFPREDEMYFLTDEDPDLPSRPSRSADGARLQYSETTSGLDDRSQLNQRVPSGRGDAPSTCRRPGIVLWSLRAAGRSRW